MEVCVYCELNEVRNKASKLCADCFNEELKKELDD